MNNIDDDWQTDVSRQSMKRYMQNDVDIATNIKQGQKISDLRNMADISVQELASYSGLSNSELLAVETGLEQLSRETARRMAERIGVDFTDLWLNTEQQ